MKGVARSSRLRLGFAVLVAASLAAPLRAGHYRWTTSGPEPGLVSQIVVSPRNPDRIAAVAGYYGQFVFWSSNRGLSWVQDENLLFALRLAQDPLRAEVLYAIGTTEEATGVLKTVNGGATWAPANAGLPDGAFWSAIGLAPSSPDTLYLVSNASPAQVYRSVDGAATWTLAAPSLATSYVSDVRVDPSNPSVVYVVGYPGILKSTDAGASWAPSGDFADALRLAIDPAAPSTLYAGTGDSGVWKSTDGGAHWAPSNVGIEVNGVRDIALDPTNPRRIWIADLPSGSVPGGIHRSTDGGGTWAPVDLGVATGLGTAVALDPSDPSRVYAAASQSMLRGHVHASADGGSTWTARDAGLSGFFSFAVACDGSRSSTAYGVSGANVSRTDDAGASWALRGTAPAGLVALVTDPSVGTTLYAGYAGTGTAGVVKSVDGGASWNPATEGLAATNLYRLAISPSAPANLLAAGVEGLFGTANGGGLWAPLLAGDTRSVAFDPEDPSILYAGQFNAAPVADGLLRSADGGASWNPPAGLPTAYPHVFDVAVSRVDSSRVYAALTAAPGQGVYRSTDRGLSFEAAGAGITPGLTATRLATDPTDAATLYVAGQPLGGAAPDPGALSPSATAPPTTVFRSRDGALSWTPLPGILPGWSVLDLSIASDSRTFYAATLSGVFQFSRSFDDLPDTDPFWTSVDAAAMNRLTAGCGAGRFCPAAPTSRASMAVFLLRGKNGAAYAPPPATGTVFGDVAAGSPAADFIEELLHEGITAGCGGGDYCPGAPLTRAAVAVLLLKAEHGGDYAPPPATGSVFADVPADAFAAAWIEELFAEGISAGCGSGNFCPDAAVSRAQAAALVVRAFGLS